MYNILVILSLICLLLAIALFATGIYVWDAALLLVLSIISAAIVVIRSRRSGVKPELNMRGWPPIYRSRWLRASAVLVSLLVAFTARSQPILSNHQPLFLLWLLAVASWCTSFIVPWLNRRGQRLTNARLPFTGVHRLEWVGVVLLLLSAGCVRGLALNSIPANLGGDEGTQLLLGIRLVSPPFGNPFATGWFSVPTMSFALYGLAMRLWGVTMAGGRALSAAAGTLTVLTTFLLGRVLGGRRFGWISALFVAFSSYHIHYSRLASNQVFDPLIGTLVLWLVWVALQVERDSTLRQLAWALAGAAAGLGWYAYFGARWVTFLVGLFIAWRWLRDRSFLTTHSMGLLTFALGWVVLVAPLLGWYYEHPSALTERYNAVSIFASGWLTREVVITGRSAFRLLLEQFWKSATAFHLTPDPVFWYFPQRPLADVISGVLMLVGMALCIWRWKWPSRALILIWFWSTLVMAWVLTENPPSSQRGLLLVPAFAYLAALGFDTLWTWHMRGQQSVRLVLSGLLVVSLCANLFFYFAIYTPRRTYGNPTAEIATRVAQYTLNNPEPVCRDPEGQACTGMIYFMGPPRLYWEFGSMAFLLRHFPGQDVMPQSLPADISTPARFVLVEDRIGEIGELTQAYPGGHMAHITNDQGLTIALVYDWVPVLK
ncbi:MAG: glycosyltransferase family 39 protein [Anaerolineae bacterium]|nr:glycosyltransferase family 39 protein [Anaerolineae bacterium]